MLSIAGSHQCRVDTPQDGCVDIKEFLDRAFSNCCGIRAAGSSRTSRWELLHWSDCTLMFNDLCLIACNYCSQRALGMTSQLCLSTISLPICSGKQQMKSLFCGLGWRGLLVEESAEPEMNVAGHALGPWAAWLQWTSQSHQSQPLAVPCHPFHARSHAACNPWIFQTLLVGSVWLLIVTNGWEYYA